MAIYVHGFGSVLFTGDDAVEFHRAMSDPVPEAASRTVREGVRMAREMQENGYVRVTLAEKDYGF